MGVGLFPLLEKEGWPRHQQKVPVPKRSGRGGQFGERVKRRIPKHFAELTTPAAPFRWLRVFLLVRSHPSFFKEGKASCLHFSFFIATFLLESLVQKWPISILLLEKERSPRHQSDDPMPP